MKEYNFNSLAKDGRVIPSHHAQEGLEVLRLKASKQIQSIRGRRQSKRVYLGMLYSLHLKFHHFFPLQFFGNFLCAAPLSQYLKGLQSIKLLKTYTLSKLEVWLKHMSMYKFHWKNELGRRYHGR